MALTSIGEVGRERRREAVVGADHHPRPDAVNRGKDRGVERNDVRDDCRCDRCAPRRDVLCGRGRSCLTASASVDGRFPQVIRLNRPDAYCSKSRSRSAGARNAVPAGRPPAVGRGAAPLVHASVCAKACSRRRRRGEREAWWPRAVKNSPGPGHPASPASPEVTGAGTCRRVLVRPARDARGGGHR